MANPDLLNIIFTKNSKPPPMVEFTVNSHLKPFLISSTRSFFWREEAKKDKNSDIVISAVRPLKGNPQAEAIASIIERSLSEDWGSVHPFSEEGFKKCLSYLEEYEDQIDILINGNEELDFEFEEERLTRTAWVPPRCAVFVPKDRQLVGDFLIFETTDFGAACLYNVVLGMAFAVDV